MQFSATTVRQLPHLLESIRLFNGKMPFIQGHLQRIAASRKALWGLDSMDPLPAINSVITHYYRGWYKVRVLYSDIVHLVEVIPYSIRPVNSLQLLEAVSLHYDHKYADRSVLERLFAQRGVADDVLLFRNGMLMDTSYANIALFDGTNWFTPERPLLQGVQRARLIAEGQLIPRSIGLQDLRDFQRIRLVNAMMTWEESPVLPVSNIFAPR